MNESEDEQESYVVTDVLKDKGNFRKTDFGSQQVVMVVFKFCVGVVIPRGRIAVQEGIRFDDLLPILAPTALERLVRLRERIFFELE